MKIERDDEDSILPQTCPALVSRSSLATLVFAARVGSTDRAGHIGRRLTQRNGRGGYARNEPKAKPEFPKDRLDGAEGWITSIGL